MRPLYIFGERDWRSCENARLPPMCPGFDSRNRRHMWAEFVVSSLPCSEVFIRVLRFSLLKNQHFQIPIPSGCQTLYREPLARVIVQALPMLDIKFTFTVYFLFALQYQPVWGLPFLFISLLCL